MLKILTGDYKQIKQHITKQYKNIHFASDIVTELQHNKGLLKKQYNVVYFIYDAKLFNNKETIEAFLSEAPTSLKA